MNKYIQIKYKLISNILCILFLVNVTLLNANLLAAEDLFTWSQLPSLPPVSHQPEALGVAGPFVGVHNDSLIIAGGANFPKPYWENDKVWHDTIWVLTKTENKQYQWINGGKLEYPIGYGASVSTAQGVVCMGGNDSSKTFSDVFLLQWDPENKVILKKSFPSLPKPCAYSGATLIGNTIYMAGGSSGHDLKTAMKNFWSLDLSKQGTQNFSWQVLPSWNGPERAFNIVTSLHNGQSNCVYVISGRKSDGQKGIVPLKDVYEFTPSSTNNRNWRKRTDIPQSVMAGTGTSIGQTHLAIFGGADGSLFTKADDLKELHPGFPKSIFIFNALSNSWITAGQVPQTHVTTQITKWDNSIIIASGEIKPRVRSPYILKAELNSASLLRLLESNR